MAIFLWRTPLAQAEAQFAIRKITADETKYYYVLSALDQDTATRLLDLISKPPREDKYKALKERLVDTFCLSKRERASRLLHTRPLGDSKPSALMDEMLALLGDHPPCLLFEQLFLERLPDDIRAQVVDADIADYRELAKRADALWAARDMGATSGNTLPLDATQKLTLPKRKRIISVSTTANLEKQQRSVRIHAIGRETSRPVASSGVCDRPSQ